MFYIEINIQLKIFQIRLLNKIKKSLVVMIYCVPLHRNLESISFI